MSLGLRVLSALLLLVLGCWQALLLGAGMLSGASLAASVEIFSSSAPRLSSAVSCLRFLDAPLLVKKFLPTRSATTSQDLCTAALVHDPAVPDG